MTRVLVAGASGVVGGRVAKLLAAQGCAVRTLNRDPARITRLPGTEAVFADALDPSALTEVANGVDIVVSCLGANVGLGLRERRPYSAVDPVANGHLLAAALARGVKRFVYVGVHDGPGYGTTRYFRAHETFVERLRASPIESTVVRPTGIFTAFDALLPMARTGVGFVIGDGCARTNPVHPDCVAEAVAGVVHRGPRDLEIGGPEVLTRADCVRTAFEALGKKPRLVHVPAGFVRLQGRIAGLFHPRLSELIEFVAAVFTHDAIAEARGTRRLYDYFAAHAR